MRWGFLTAVFLASAVAQVVAINFLAGRSFFGFAHNPLIVYHPFVTLMEPFVRRHYGGNDGSLGPLLMWGCGLGVAVYSSLLSIASTWLFYVHKRKSNV
jgi:hypothetical protein